MKYSNYIKLYGNLGIRKVIKKIKLKLFHSNFNNKIASYDFLQYTPESLYRDLVHKSINLTKQHYQLTLRKFTPEFKEKNTLAAAKDQQNLAQL